MAAHLLLAAAEVAARAAVVEAVAVLQRPVVLSSMAVLLMASGRMPRYLSQWRAICLQRWHGRRNKRQPRPSGRQLIQANPG